MTHHGAPHHPDVNLRVSQAAADAYVIEVAGNLDHYTTHQLDTTIDHVLAAGAITILIDLKLTTFLDSSGLNSLISGYHAATRAHARLALIAPSTSVHRMLSITGIGRILPTFPTTDTALTRPGEPPS